MVGGTSRAVSRTMITVILLLVLAAFVVTIASAIGKAPLWVAVLLLVVVHLLTSLPLGR